MEENSTTETTNVAASAHRLAAFFAPIIGAAIGAAVGMIAEANWAHHKGWSNNPHTNA